MIAGKDMIQNTTKSIGYSENEILLRLFPDNEKIWVLSD